MQRTYKTEDKFYEEDLELRSWEMKQEAIMHELWDEAHFIARNNYEEDYGCSWDDADKYERQDYVQSVFENLCAREGLKL